MEKVLVTGGNGQLGSELKTLALQFPNYAFTFIDLEDLDLTNTEAVNAFFARQAFDVIINCAAYTAVDKAEEEVTLAYTVNEEVPRMLAAKAKEIGATLIHISTDFVFKGNVALPLKESDPTDPVSVYGKSKLAGEKAIQETIDQYYIIRTSWLYSTFGKNFVKTIINLAQSRDKLTIIADQLGTPTYAQDLAKSIMAILESGKGAYGLYHCSNEGVASWYDFAHAIVRYTDIDCQVLPIDTDGYPTPAERPKYSLMDKSLIKVTFGMELPHWTDSLKTCLDQLQ